MQPEYFRLREVAGALARGEDPRPLLRDADVDALVSCAQSQRLAGVLYAKLALSLDTEMAALRARLRRASLATSLENGRLRKQLESAIKILNAAGIVPTLLKGAARMWNAQADWQCHPSVDLDVLVAPEQVEHARAALLDAGYFDIMPAKFARHYERDHHHAAPLAAEGGVTVEIHRALGPRRWFSSDLTQNGLQSHITEVERDGMRAGVLDAPASALHLAVHGVPHASLRDLYLLASLLCSMTVEQRTAVRRMADAETKERVRLQCVLFEAAALARIPWPVDEATARSADWSLMRVQLPVWLRTRSDCADAYFCSDHSSVQRFFSHAFRAPVAEPAARLLTHQPVRVLSRLAVGAYLVGKFAAWIPFKRSARAALRDTVRRSDALYGRLRAYKALAATRKPQKLAPEVATLLKHYPELRRFVDEVRRAHSIPSTRAGRRNRIAAALERLLAGSFLREYVNAELARLAHDEPLGRLGEYERRLPLFRIPGFALNISFINVRRAAREIASTASNAWIAPLHGGVRVLRYRVPEELRRGLFSREAKLEPLGTQTLRPLQVTPVLRTTQAYALEAEDAEISAIVFEATQRDDLIWRFNPATLQCIGVNPSDVKITRIKETLRLIEAMKLHEAAPYVQSVAKHSSHFLRWSAISTLYKLQSPSALPLLRKATRDPHPHVRRAASALLDERPRNGANA